MHPLAGKLPPQDFLQDLPQLISDYYTLRPDVNEALQAVSFGTSGHRGSASAKSFNEAHILAITQAICDYRQDKFKGGVFVAKDTHALSDPALRSVIEVLVGNGCEVFVDAQNGFTPTPSISHAIISHNNSNEDKADGIVITPSHNPPSDGGLKYNLPNGGPSDTQATSFIEKRANEILRDNLAIKHVPFEEAIKKTTPYDYTKHYVEDLQKIIDFDVIRGANIKILADPMGGAGFAYWEAINTRYGLDIKLINNYYDPSFRFVPLDKDGKIRMDCSSQYTMGVLSQSQLDFDIALANDTDFDRHGIVTKQGLVGSNQMLCVMIDYLAQTRGFKAKIGKTAVSSAMIDRVARSRELEVHETPVGFKWFVDVLQSGECFFAGEESAGSSFLAFDGSVFSTDKDGITACLLAAEIFARQGISPYTYYEDLEKKFGKSFYKRIDVACSLEEKNRIKAVDESHISLLDLGGEKITKISTKASGNSIGGIKCQSENAWFALRPSGTESLYKIYAQSFVSEEHLDKIIEQAKKIVASL